jgi:hypothetical protein
LVLHYTGECSALCDHADLGPAHLKFTCKAQVVYFISIMKSVIVGVPGLLSPFGLLTINWLESKHGEVTHWRPKRVKLMADECQYGEDRGFMADIQLVVAYWGGPRLYPEFELAERVNSEFGLAVVFSEAETAFLHSRLDMRVAEKQRRDTPEWKAAKAARLQRKARALASREDSSYISGGTEAAFNADAAAAAALADPAGLGSAIESGTAGEEHVGDGYDEEDDEEESTESTVMTDEQVEAFLQVPEGAELTSDAAGLLNAHLSRAEAGEGSVE